MNMFKQALFPIMLGVYSASLLTKVLIITHSYNRPDFIGIQAEMFKKFMLDDYEFVVFSDAPHEDMDKKIQRMCARWDVTHIRVPQEIHTRPYLAREPGDPLHRPNIRHANVVQYSMDILGFDHNGPVFVFDSDMFLVRPLSMVQALEGWDIVAIPRGADNGVYYLWPGCMLFAMNKLPNKRTMNFNCGTANGVSVDSGGNLYYYLNNNPTLKIRYVEELFSYHLFGPDRFAPHLEDRTTSVAQQIAKLKEWGFNEKEIKFLQKKPHTISFMFDHCFLHYRAGSNYDNQSQVYEQHKMDLISDYLNDIFS